MIRLVRGFKDILPGETGLWQHVEGLARELFGQFGFAEVRPPMLEQTELFARSIGADTDIVEKEMYTFTDQGGKSLTMRPEATASVVRAYIEHKLYAKDPVWKLYTLGPMFRRERPQKGRYRQFYQINAEVFGLHDPKADAELVFLLMTLMHRLEVPGVALHINSLGCSVCRPRFKEALDSFLEGRTEKLCSDCLRRRTRNPLRIFDCKVATCKEAMVDAPSIVAHLCEACRNHFHAVQGALEGFGIPFEMDHRLVRGLDYYTRTTFEVLGQSLGAQDAVAGGGRYDGLVKALGGPDQPGVGFAIGLDRLIELLAERANSFEKRPHLFIAALGARAQESAFRWVQEFRGQKIRAEMDFEGRSLKAQMRRANKLEASYALIVGDRELDDGAAVLRDLETKQQDQVPVQGLVEVVAGQIRSGPES
ncbi:MAG: histidine--tRNA ligase [Thermodesulfobacteriota bacterium]|nr:histidine--tRNA ligase [Thermodesulfobacteriota bacterium]